MTLSHSFVPKKGYISIANNESEQENKERVNIKFHIISRNAPSVAYTVIFTGEKVDYC